MQLNVKPVKLQFSVLLLSHVAFGINRFMFFDVCLIINVLNEEDVSLI